MDLPTIEQLYEKINELDRRMVELEKQPKLEWKYYPTPGTSYTVCNPAPLNPGGFKRYQINGDGTVTELP